MTATYKVNKTPNHLVQIQTPPYYIEYIVGGDTNWDYERRAKTFYDTEEAAHKAGKRYLRKMKQNGFEI